MGSLKTCRCLLLTLVRIDGSCSGWDLAISAICLAAALRVASLDPAAHMKAGNQSQTKGDSRLQDHVLSKRAKSFCSRLVLPVPVLILAVAGQGGTPLQLCTSASQLRGVESGVTEAGGWGLQCQIPSRATKYTM